MTTKAQLAAVDEILSLFAMYLNGAIYLEDVQAKVPEIISRHFPGDGEDTERPSLNEPEKTLPVPRPSVYARDALRAALDAQRKATK